ncbi:MAG: sodium:calcium antiporter [Ktedonobacteraceae bacterium]|nr:sodium:calcium antiporter [Ktedonobacteraceae bacterium]
MFHSLPLPLLLGIFLAGAVAVWFAGIQLSNTTDVLADRFHFGQAMGGLLFLAVATNLPEVAITVSAALTHNLGIAIGNILGGISIQTAVLVILDAFGLKDEDSLTYRGTSLQVVLEGVLVIAVLVIAIMGTQMPKTLIFARLTPDAVLITATWIVGVWLLSKARTDLPWHEKGRAPEAAHPSDKKQDRNKSQKWSTARVIIVFGIAAIVTLMAGAALEESGNAIADHIGLSGVLFGATILAAATSLPEVSTGLDAVKIGDYPMAFGDIFGGNAFLPVLFLLAVLISGAPVLPLAQKSDIYLAGLGILLTTVYIYGLIFRPRKQILRMGIDSLVVLLLYILGIAGLFALTIYH